MTNKKNDRDDDAKYVVASSTVDIPGAPHVGTLKLTGPIVIPVRDPNDFAQPSQILQALQDQPQAVYMIDGLRTIVQDVPPPKVRVATRRIVEEAIVISNVLATNNDEDLYCGHKPHCASCTCDNDHRSRRERCGHDDSWDCVAAALGVSKDAVDLWIVTSGAVSQFIDEGPPFVGVVGHAEDDSGPGVWGEGRTEEQALADARKNGQDQKWDANGFAFVELQPQLWTSLYDGYYYCRDLGIDVERDQDGRIIRATDNGERSLIRTGMGSGKVNDDLEAEALLREGWLPVGWVRGR